MAGSFTWVPFYRELADRLVEWQSRQGELIALLEKIREEGFTITSLLDQDAEGARFLLKEIDPFTFFGTFNRGIRDEQRIGILSAMKSHFGVERPLPEDFDGIPVINNLSSWFIAYQYRRQAEDVGRLWRVFRLALSSDPLNNPEFLNAFDDALKVRQTKLNLTFGLFWIRPDAFLSLDQWNQSNLGIKIRPDGLTADVYREATQSALSKGKSLFETSLKAWQDGSHPLPVDPSPEKDYWLVGAYWSSTDPPDQTGRFLAEGIWQNGYADRYLDDVKAMGVGDRIAIKSTSTQKKNLPFDARDHTVSRLTIKAIGTIVANHNDGRTVEVRWDSTFQPKEWYFYTERSTIWRLRRENELAQRLIAFTFQGADQDYDWFCQKWWGTNNEVVPSQPYSIDDIISSGIFLSDVELRQVLDRLQSKKNLILQGAPGVGKTFLARKLAYALMEEQDDKRIEFVQFHQTYSYEDFVRGYRPLPSAGGTFGLQDGVFLEFCRQAASDPERPYVFIVDEINRGNLSQIFGELLMLIESDKRGPRHALPLVYRKEGEARFFIPENLFFIGLMNLADRSLALVDYALRRRFAFMSLRAQYGSSLFRTWLAERNMNTGLMDLIIDRMSAINQQIEEEPLLGENYQIGHSFFCPRGANFAGLDRQWYEGIIETEIVPLLKEYWFDDSKKADDARERLLAK